MFNVWVLWRVVAVAKGSVLGEALLAMRCRFFACSEDVECLGNGSASCSQHKSVRSSRQRELKLLRLRSSYSATLAVLA